jgi:transposase
MRYALTDSEWDTIQPILPNKSRGMPRVDDRRVLNGIFWVLRSGAPWRDLPDQFGPYTTCYNRFNRWGKAGIWDGILNAVANASEAGVQMLDTTIVRVHQHGACAKRTIASNVGRSRGGLTTKIDALVDGKRRPIRLALSAGQQHDSIGATQLLDGLTLECLFLADRAYDSDAIRELVRMRGAWANIPPKKPQAADLFQSTPLPRPQPG